MSLLIKWEKKDGCNKVAKVLEKGKERNELYLEVFFFYSFLFLKNYLNVFLFNK
jgi:hypothetical protein